MQNNLATWDRIFRVLAALLLEAGAVWSPLPESTGLRVAGFGLMGAYMLYTALAGTCLGYRLIGFSTCPLKKPA